MPTDFHPLAEFLRPAPPERESCDVPESASAQPDCENRELQNDDALPAQLFCSDLALARLAAFEAYERATRAMLRALAMDVLGRELTLAGVDIANLVRSALDKFANDEPVAVVVAPTDADGLQTSVPVRADPSLSPGDLIVEVCDGTIDVRLAIRLQMALDASWRLALQPAS